MMETWHWGLIGIALVLLSGLMVYLYYKSRRRHSQQKQQHIDHHQNPVIIIDRDDQTPPPHNSSHLQHDSRSTTPSTFPHACIMTPLSAPPAQFFRDQTQSRWMPTTTKSPSPASFQNDHTNTILGGTGWTDNNHRFLSLSPFLGHTHSSPSPSPSPISTCSVQTRTPSPALAKLASTWKNRT